MTTYQDSLDRLVAIRQRLERGEVPPDEVAATVATARRIAAEARSALRRPS